jgi:hypothetical protein
MQNSQFNPESVYDFKKSKLNKDARGFSTTITAGTTGTLDYTLTDDCLISGGCLLCVTGNKGDKVNFQVLMGQTVVAQYVTDWYITPDSVQQSVPQSRYPAKLVAGLTLRICYTSTGETDVWIAINYDIEKVIV